MYEIIIVVVVGARMTVRSNVTAMNVPSQLWDEGCDGS